VANPLTARALESIWAVRLTDDERIIIDGLAQEIANYIDNEMINNCLWLIRVDEVLEKLFIWEE
jgi:hypothetical protein